ncbi:Putative amidohydrolase YtcJ [Vanrija pseudolonga]|uniref:Amidohydrolase YtcJ n=1 Tax=Vanrija pseudolonga TaxID=143232 RepID=A0AAF0Y9E0_9TREE|nr:Putative amidohydrolase YtcJ [Vanrija pseudolonga]
MRRLFKNARIFTSVGGDSTLHDALVIEDDKVVFVGSRAVAESKGGPSAEVTDLQGRVVLPGLIDGHIHVVQFGASLSKIDCLGLSFSQITAAVKEVYLANPSAKMIHGKSFLFDALGEPPHHALLDAVAPNVPVFIASMDLHSTLLNTAALDAIGVTRDTPDPKGGEFVRDAAGELTGLCLETANVKHIWPWVAHHTSLDERVAALDAAFENMLSSGLTGGIEMALRPEDLEAFEEYIRRHGRLPVRISARWFMRPEGTEETQAEQVREAARLRDHCAQYAPWFNIVGIKIVSDGVVDSCTAFLKEPYPSGQTPGPIWPADELTKVVVLADTLDLQIAVRALGDAASEQALDAFEAAMMANGERAHRRHRIEHLEVVTPESVARLTRLGVTASLQPVHADPVYAKNWWDQLGHDARCDRAFPWSEFVHAGAKVAFGTDAPVAPVHALPNIYTAGTRQSSVDPSLELSTDPRIRALEKLCVPLDKSIRYYTAGCAQSVRQDDVGTLEPGKQADFCVLDVDPFRDGIEALRQAQAAVTETWVAGRCAWLAKK